MIDITPIYESDGDRHYREFFRPQFISHRLGRSGQWQGQGTTRFGLENPVQLTAFESLLHGRGPGGEEQLFSRPGEGKRELGWRFTLSDGGRFSMLWGLAPNPVRARIELGHAGAARFVVSVVERRLDRSRRLGLALLRKTKARLKEWVVPRAVPQQPVPPVQSKDRDLMHSH